MFYVVSTEVKELHTGMSLFFSSNLSRERENTSANEGMIGCIQ